MAQLNYGGLAGRKSTGRKGGADLLKVKQRHSMHAHELSRVYGHFCNKDSASSIFTTSDSFGAGITRLSELAAGELLSSRVLSRDILAVNDELSDIFEEMADLLRRRQFYDHYVLTGMP